MREAIDDLEVCGLAEGPEPLCERHRVVEHRIEVARLKTRSGELIKKNTGDRTENIVGAREKPRIYITRAGSNYIIDYLRFF